MSQNYLSVFTDAVHRAELLLNPDHPSRNKQSGNLVMHMKL